MKGREESVSKKGISLPLITRGFGGKIGRGGLRRRLWNEIGRVFFFIWHFPADGRFN